MQNIDMKVHPKNRKRFKHLIITYFTTEASNVLFVGYLKAITVLIMGFQAVVYIRNTFEGTTHKEAKI